MLNGLRYIKICKNNLEKKVKFGDNGVIVLLLKEFTIQQVHGSILVLVNYITHGLSRNTWFAERLESIL